MKSIHRLLSFATASAALFLLCNCHTTGSTGATGPACCATPGAACCATGPGMKCPPGCTKPCCAKKH